MSSRGYAETQAKNQNFRTFQKNTKILENFEIYEFLNWKVDFVCHWLLIFENR